VPESITEIEFDEVLFGQSDKAGVGPGGARVVTVDPRQPFRNFLTPTARTGSIGSE